MPKYSEVGDGSPTEAERGGATNRELIELKAAAREDDVSVIVYVVKWLMSDYPNVPKVQI